MKLLKLIPGAAIALTVLIPLKANAENLPNGWSQEGKGCEGKGNASELGDFFIKLQKNSDNSQYGVFNYTDDSWNLKYVTLVEANQRMNDKCGATIYYPDE